MFGRDRGVAHGQRASDEKLIASLEREAEEHAELLTSYINHGLEMIRYGRSGQAGKGKLRSGGNRVSWTVSAASAFVTVDLYGYFGGGRLVSHLAQRGYEVTGKETDPGYHYYRVFVAVPRA